MSAKPDRASKAGRPQRWVAVGFLLPITVVVAGAANAVTLEDAVRAALQTNPDVGIVSENRRAIDAELRQARAGFLPSIDLRGAAGEEFTNDPGSRKRARTTGDSRSRWMPRYESGISLRQMLYDGQETELEVERQQARTISASRRVRESSELVALDAIEAYLDALRQRELTAVAEENVRNHERTLALVETRERGGAATVADVQQAAARLATAEEQLTDAEARRRDADATYLRVVGEAPESLVRPITPLSVLPETLGAAIDRALTNNPSVAVSRADVEAARKEYLATKSPFLPRFDLEVDANSNRNIDGERGQDTSVSALVVMRYNLFRGGRDAARRQEFISRLAEARQRLNRSVRQAEEETRLSWNALQSARERIAVLRREVAANEQVTITYRQQYDLGGREILDLLDADRDLFISRSSLTTAEFIEYFSIYRVLADGGVLLSALDVEGLGESDNDLDPIVPLSVENVDADRPDDATDAPTLQPPSSLEQAPDEVGPDDASLPLPGTSVALVPASGPSPAERTLEPVELKAMLPPGTDVIDPVETDTVFLPPGDGYDMAAVQAGLLTTAAGPDDGAEEPVAPDAPQAVTELPAARLDAPAAGLPQKTGFPDFADDLQSVIVDPLTSN